MTKQANVTAKLHKLFDKVGVATSAAPPVWHTKLGM